MSDRPLQDALREADLRASQEAARREEARVQAEHNIQDFIRMMNEAGIAPAPIPGSQGSMGWLASCYPAGNWDRCTPTYILPDGRVSGHAAEAAGRPEPFSCFRDPWELGVQAEHIIKSRNALIHPPPIVARH